jgi:uncharacterized repeat protein (TIGR03803 family)
MQVACIVTAFWMAAAIASPAQSFTTIHSFTGPTQGGSWPGSGLTQGSDGNLYGTTSSGGGGSCTFGCGTIFKITPEGAFTMLYSFQEPEWGPSSGLIQANDGNFYGTTAYGGGSSNCYETNGCGTVYAITPEGTMTTLYSFNEIAAPLSGVIQARDGNFYGTTYYGGGGSCTFGCGTIFKITPEGTLTTLYSFAGTSGPAPGGLVQATDGNFYGTTLYGGSGSGYNGNGTVFEVTAGGTLTMLYSFCTQANCGDGGGPAVLIQATDGNFYGTTLYGGAHEDGTVFKITAGGTLTTIYSFCADPNCSDGSEPNGLMQAADGNFYGTTLHGGGGGTIFEIAAGNLTTIHRFATSAGSYPDGASPFAGVMQTTNGSFNGTTGYGGTSSNCTAGCGTVFTFGLPAATLSETLNLGEETLNETSAAKRVSLKNSGVALLVVSNVTVNGNFAISANTCTGATLTNGKNCNVTVTFTPTAIGLQTGALSFTDNTGTNPQTVALSGTGIEPATLYPASATYGAQVVGTTSAAKTFTVTNNRNVTLTNVAISTTGDFAVSATTCTTSLAAKEKCTISVTFTPTQTGTRTGELAVGDSASNSPQTSSLKGTGK